ncbi:MAG: NAD(P)/FAD-dependent oxidoreductase [Methanomicrobiales archaeon]|nr:NAD(P)/FAD-dependent oxidoreductase [Methanomicrobiales archaeon]
MESSHLKTDVVIVGGGTTGLTLAKFLSEEQVDFILLEADTSFFEKSCGEGITPEIGGCKFFDLYESQVGIERITDSMRIRLDYGDVEFDLSNIMVDKRAVEQELARQAISRGGDVRTGERVRQVTRVRDQIRIEPQGIEAKVVVGADGYGSIVRRFMGVEKPRHFGVAAAGYWAEESPGNACIVEFKKSVAQYGYAWLFPRKNDWNIGIGSVRAPLFRQQLARFQQRYPGATGWRTAVVPLDLPVQSYGKDAILVGDAASQVVSVFADGILPGMICAREAAKVLIGLSHRNFANPDLSAYEKGWKSMMGDTFRNGYFVHRLMMGLYFSDHLLYGFMKLMKRVYR